MDEVVVDLDSNAPVDAVLDALADEPGLVCLWGDGWGSTMIASRPIRVSASAAVLGDQGDGLGWFGWLGYDRPHHFQLHDHLLRLVDGRWQFEMIWSPERAEELAAAEARYRAALAGASPSTWRVGHFAGSGRDDHLSAVEHAIGLIRDGELYQVNVCTRLSADFTGRPLAMFSMAVRALRPAFGAYVSDGVTTVISLSPELFLRREGREVVSSPIKGTRPRTTAGATQLRGSAKDVAENVMIVDLVRNDLGRVSEPGSVHARELLEIQPHPGVWHLVSSVGATLRDEVDDADLVAATFPPGSVTGAPKLRAVRAISELEPSARGVYTGAVGFASADRSVFGVAIRTFEIEAGRIELGVGGGVTVDSVPMLEWQETGDKAAPLIAAIGGSLAREPAPESTVAQRAGGLLETMLAVRGSVLRLSDHLARIDLSCRELYGAPLPEGVAPAVRASATGPPRGAIRLTVTSSLEFEVDVADAPTPPAGLELRTARRPGLWRHKWADRSWIADPAALFVAEDGAVLETTFGNVFLIEGDGGLITSPLRDDLLPGITRLALLDLARDHGRRIELRPFGLDELFAASAVLSTSSLSGVVAINSLDGRRLGQAPDLIAELNSELGFLGSAQIVS